MTATANWWVSDDQAPPDAANALPAIDISDAALQRVTAQLAETAEEHDRTAQFPWKGIQAVHDAGLLRLGIAPRYGGGRAELHRQRPGLRGPGAGRPVGGADHRDVGVPARRAGRRPVVAEALYRQLVQDSLSRPTLVNLIRAEPEWGAPVRGGLPSTRVRRTDDGWVLNGLKGFATGSEGLSHHLVWVATEDDDAPLVGHAIVPADTPGIEIVKTWDHLGLRASSTHDVRYTDVRIPLDHFRGKPQTSDGALHPSFVAVNMGVSALYLGVARAAQAFFLRFANERVPTALGRPIATVERIQAVAGEIEAQLVQAEELALGVARRFDDHDPRALERAGLAKALIARSAIAAVQAAVAAIGNPGLTRNNALERHLRDVQCSRVHPPQEDIILLGAGRRTLTAAAAH